MDKAYRIAGICAFLFLAACAEVRPFIDTRKEAGQVAPVGRSTPDRIAVCYNPLWHKQEAARKLADAACVKTNRRAVFDADGTKYFTCRLLTPSVAFYDCIK
ncbi:MAG: hypothetical protein PHX68_00770 [Alphaproteobacteria bacterium]|nr:hypothetical protein [Alphaproteobacteria bacterium]